MLWWLLPSIIGTVLSLYTARQAGLMMRPPSGIYMTALSVMIAWWCAGQWASFLWNDLDYRLMVAKLQYLAIATVPILWFSVALTFSGYSRFLQRWHPALWLMPVATIALAFSNEYHLQVWSRFAIAPDSLALEIEYGPWFNTHATYSYSAVTIATFMLAQKIGFARGHRLQFMAVILSPVIVIAVNAPYILGIDLLPFDPTPSGFAVVSLILLYALRHQMFAVLPVAREYTLEKLNDGIVVIDDHGLIADSNPAARQIFGTEPMRIGRHFTEALPAGIALKSDVSTEVQLPDKRWLDIRISRLQSIDGPIRGQVALIRDVTREKGLQASLLQSQKELEALNSKLNNLAHTDELTGLANRRSLYERIRSEWSRSTRHNKPLSIILIDFDNFKLINDSYGHQVGDQVLQRASATIRQIIRPEDLAARHGGEELAILLPDTNSNAAVDIAQRIGKALEALEYQDEAGQAFVVTVSSGVASRCPDDKSPDVMIARADKALYQSKADGRNRVTLADAVSG
jgi:diguanylate cyclase (GGDEF)-like protein